MRGFDFAGRVAVVTGGGTGIGAATAMLFGELGAEVMIAGRRPEPLANTAERIGAATGRRCQTLAADLRHDGTAERLIAATIAAFGRIDILVNNAGIARQAPLAELTPGQWRGQVETNLGAAFYCSHAALPHFTEQGRGVIVNISSAAGMHGTKGVGAYSAAKAGTQMLTRVSAAEWGPRGIRVNCVAPGMVVTEHTRERWAKVGFDGDGAAKAFPIGRVGEVADIANAVVFLASDAAAFITGQTLAVDGGPTLGGMIPT